jgi:DNA-binding winged helix-turn-helix (wHTH) protein
MLAFCWYSTRHLPSECDLAPGGWTCIASPDPAATCAPPDDCAILVDHCGIGPVQRVTIAASGAETRARMLWIGVAGGAERARLLAAGFGDALAPDADLAEVEQRALRVLRKRNEAGLVRRAGPVLLDLAARDGWSEGRRLALHPMEFALLWRLAREPGRVVPRAELLRDVWRIPFDPGTNRVEVHISRLRRKLAAVGADDLVETAREGGYRLVSMLAKTRRIAAGPARAFARTGT